MYPTIKVIKGTPYLCIDIKKGKSKTSRSMGPITSVNSWIRALKFLLNAGILPDEARKKIAKLIYSLSGGEIVQIHSSIHGSNHSKDASVKLLREDFLHMLIKRVYETEGKPVQKIRVKVDGKRTGYYGGWIKCTCGAAVKLNKTLQNAITLFISDPNSNLIEAKLEGVIYCQSCKKSRHIELIVWTWKPSFSAEEDRR